MKAPILLTAAMLTVAGCQTTTRHAAIYYPRDRSYAPPVSVNTPLPHASNFDYAQTAPVFGNLFLCAGSVSNSGATDPSGQSLIYTPFIYTHSETLLRNPTEGACLSSGFGYRGAAIGGGKNHNGIDLANAQGGYVFAAGDGTVMWVGDQAGYGLTIQIDHGNGVRTLYGHLSEANFSLRQGASVRAGDAIGRMGKSGNATGVHLHYEVEIYGRRVDPLNYATQPHDHSDPYPGS